MYLKSTLADISRARIQLAVGAFLPAWTTKCFKDRGWISISKAPLQTVTVKSREVEDRRDRVEPIYSPASGRILSTPEEGKHCRVVSSDEKESSNKWQCQKMRQCGEAVGLTVDGCKGGWDSLLAYAYTREDENRAA